MIHSFKELTKEQEPFAGGKGKTLARLYQAGYRVPDGFIILPAAFDGVDLTKEAWAQVQSYLARMRGNDRETSFAVRSSAWSEDSAQASFAGEFETVLDVRTDEDLWEAIHVVRLSRYGARVQAYSQAQGLGEATHEIAVVIQRLIQADFSGVLFTADPVTGDMMHMTGNFVRGLGEKLVSGQSNAQIFTFDRPRGTYHGPAELKRVARELYRTASRIEEQFKGPQDIEWAVAGGQLHILQARPITTLRGYKQDTAEWNDSLTGKFLWSGTNLAEAAPFVLTPFSCSLRKGMEVDGMDLSDSSSIGLSGYPMAGVIGGRGYMNLSVQVSVSRPFFGGDTRKTAHQLTALWGGIPEDVEIPLIPISSWVWWTRVMPGLARLGMRMGRLRKKIPAFIAENPRRCAEGRERIQRVANGAELANLWRNEIEPYSSYAFFLVSAGTTELPRQVELELQKLVGPEDANALLSNLSGLSSPLESLGPVVGLAKVARGEMSRDAYLEAYGHRGVNETESAWARPMEDPTWLDRQLAEFAKNPVDVDALFAKQQAAYQATWQRFCERYPGKVKLMQRRLKQAAQAANLREVMRSEATRGGLVLRAFALRAGELTGLGADIFFLTIAEVLACLEGDDTARRFIPLRKEIYARHTALPPYPPIIVGRFDPFPWAADPNRRSDVYDADASSAPHNPEAATLIKGFAGALGVVEGTVRRLDALEDSDTFQAGEVLVTNMTNIAWTPLFPRAAAIVTDLGAPLSHAAIVARELGIPAVVGCVDATMRLKTGDRVRVDGGQGRVEILKS